LETVFWCQCSIPYSNTLETGPFVTECMPGSAAVAFQQKNGRPSPRHGTAQQLAGTRDFSSRTPAGSVV